MFSWCFLPLSDKCVIVSFFQYIFIDSVKALGKGANWRSVSTNYNHNTVIKKDFLINVIYLSVLGVHMFCAILKLESKWESKTGYASKQICTIASSWSYLCIICACVCVRDGMAMLTTGHKQIWYFLGFEKNSCCCIACYELSNCQHVRW